LRSLGQRIERWDDLLALRDRPVHVVGAGSVEGAHLLLFLLDHGFTKLVGHDFSPEAEFGRAFTRVHVGWPKDERLAMLERVTNSVDLRFRARYLEGIEDAEAIAVTQAWYLYDANRPLLESPDLQARFFGLAQLYLALAPGRVVGVSGSQGKSTTTQLLGDILVAAGRDVIRAGNDRHGQQALGRLETASPDSILLLEISNRHLKMLDRSPNVAVMTNVFPNHLDEHGGWDGYVAAKTGLVAHQQPGDIAVLNADLEVTRRMVGATTADVYWFGRSTGDRGERGVRVEKERLVDIGLGGFELATADIPLPGPHNLENVAAAAAVALAMETGPMPIHEAVRRFRGLKHRLQFVWEAGGVRYYDDLNSTTPTATEAALRTLGENVVWILGGDDKGLDPSDLAQAARGAVKLALALPGPGTERITPVLAAEGIAVEPVADLPLAVARAAAVAQTGDRVLLSPACPGFFTLFYGGASDVGFKKLVRATTLGEGSRVRDTAAAEPEVELKLPTSPPARTPRR
jgi:UDP-N-acetylmuramoylalanine--D-glutamate ligase